MKRVISLLIVFFLSNLVMAANGSSIVMTGDVVIVGIGSTGTTNITLDSTSKGLSGYNISISLSDSSVATIVSVAFPSWATLHSNSSLPASSVWMKAADLNKQIETGATNVLLAILSLESIQIGMTSVNISITKLDDDKGYPITKIVQNATATVVQNQPPNQPSDPNPADAEIDVSITPMLRWTGGDPNPVDTVTYDVYFGTSSLPPLRKNNQTSTSYIPGALAYNNQYYWKIVVWDNHGASSSGSTWSFTTKEESPGGGGGTPPNPTNDDPVADANGPYEGVPDEEIEFDGDDSSDSDGIITNYNWDFGDNTTGYEVNPAHAYDTPGEYTVILTVTDNEGATGTNETTATILVPNKPPSDPEIDGPRNGTKNAEYTYTAVSIDPDNDTIQYTFDWDDGTDTTSDFLVNGTTFTTVHEWAAAGIYSITVYAIDEYSAISDTVQLTVLIDVYFCEDMGYLIDHDKDGTYDSFFCNKTGNETMVELKDGKYLIDTDGDGDWEYRYDFEAGLILHQKEDKRFPGFELLITLMAIALTIFWKRMRKQ